MNKQAFWLFLPAIIICITLSIIFWAFGDEMIAKGIDSKVVISGNALIFLVTLIAYIMEIKGFASSSNPVFLRMFYGSFLIKMMVLITSAFIYIISVKKNLNKPALFTCMALYVVYTFIEVRALMIIGKQKKHV
jgi:hypothetical protein